MCAQAAAQKNLNLKPECNSAYNDKNVQLNLKNNFIGQANPQELMDLFIHMQALNIHASAGNLFSSHF